MAYKFNNGNGAIICNICRIIIKENIDPPTGLNRVDAFDVCPKCLEIKVSEVSKIHGKDTAKWFKNIMEKNNNVKNGKNCTK